MVYTGLGAQFYSLGLNATFGFLYWDVYKDKRELSQLVSSMLGLMLLIQVFFISIGLVFGESLLPILVKSKEFTFLPFFVAVLFFSAFMVYYEFFLYYYRNEGKLRQYATVSISTLVLLTIGTLLGVVWLDLKATGAVLGRTFGYGLVIVVFLSLFIAKHGLSLNIKKWKYLLAFSFPLFINTIIGAFGYSADRLIIERLDTLETLGIYAFAIVIVSVIEIWFNALNNALSPTLYKLVNESLKEKVKEIQGLAHLIIYSVILAIVLLLALLIPVMEWLIPENFHSASLYVPILATAFIWRVFTTLSSYSLYTKKKTKYFLFNQSSSILFIIILSYIAYQFWGTIGIACAVFCTRVLEFMVMYYIASKAQKLPFKLRKFIYLAVFIGLGAIACSFLLHLGMAAPWLILCTPLLLLILLSPVLLRTELRNMLYVLKNRKELF
jgi:O-antigen/teichoic acid export membrane protein